ncbi:hypothetical protein PAXINDRAFT_18561 [Paxillus involutus ATCC 200175]|uniref:Uncharacterized protein n=1 Tax=Paxillus involutus ATCC 200175 TaxID=664439 RepID=A0A0C9TLT2_PAXIN|nr:hypothetical protein PAXINDRAFT_18561 [Paxillus involutus ATCC 200175]
MSTLNNSIGLRVIRGDADVVDIVPGSKDVQGLDEWQTIVSYNFSKWAPSAEDILKDIGSQCYTIFCSKHPPLRISGEHTTSLDDVPIATRFGHLHGVDVSLVKEAPMTGTDVPFHIFDEQWPPEVQKESRTDCEDTFVPKVIMSLLNQSIMLHLWHNELVTAVGFSTP